MKPSDAPLTVAETLICSAVLLAALFELKLACSTLLLGVLIV